jgi:propanol-preferring alcohol dehydrogenase
MADAGVTAYKAVFNNVRVVLARFRPRVDLFLFQVKKGDRVLIIGAGGLGHLAVQFAKHIGATVFAVDMRPEARELAEKLGAKAYDTQTLMTLTSASGSSPGGATGGNQFTVDVVIDFVADVGSEFSAFLCRNDVDDLMQNESYSAINLGYAATKDNSAFFNKGSKIVLVGVSLVDLPIQSAFFVSNEVSGT